jgi:hypothetical protein
MGNSNNKVKTFDLHRECENDEPDHEKIQTLLKNNDPNQLDYQGYNCLHLCINSKRRFKSKYFFSINFISNLNS